MTVDDARAVRATPVTVGWATVASAAHSMRQLPVPMLLTVVSNECEPIWIDFGSGRYFCERAVADMPAEPTGIKLYSQAIQPGVQPYPWVAWRSMDPLLWQIGRLAFGGERAGWMRPGDRYALERWPNLTEIPHTADEIRMIATLANGFLTAGELALLTGVDEPTAQRLLNTLSLMGAVKAAGGPLAPPAVVAQAQAKAEKAQASEADAAATEQQGAERSSGGFGFFARLRDRLGAGR